MDANSGNDQRRFWNGDAGRGWANARPILDRAFEPFESLLSDAAAARGARRVLDVGCGAGATTLAIAKKIGAEGTFLGIDVSKPLIDAARARAASEGSRATFELADAETRAFPPGSFDSVVSRFGVMFFGDSVAAFANLRSACVATATLDCLVWRAAKENPFMTAAEEAAEPLLPGVSARSPDAPGQFFLADADRTRRLVEQAGWRDVAIEPLDRSCSFAAEDLDAYLTSLGPVARAYAAADAPFRRALLDRVRPAFDRFRVDGSIRFDARCSRVTARAYER
jgi:SAM-dependent methyltransferase